MLKLKSFLPNFLLISLTIFLLLPSYINSAATNPFQKPKPPKIETPPPPQPPPEVPPQPPKVTPQPSELPKESKPPKELPESEQRSEKKGSFIPDPETELVSPFSPAKGYLAQLTKNGNLYGDYYIVIKNGKKISYSDYKTLTMEDKEGARFYGDPSTLNKTIDGKDIPEDKINRSDIREYLNSGITARDVGKVFVDREPKRETSSSVEAPKQSESIYAVPKIEATINWESGSLWHWFVDELERAFVDQLGRAYGRVIRTKYGIYGDPSYLNKDEEGQKIPQSMIDHCKEKAEEGFTSYKLPESDGEYKLPESDNKFLRPKVGPGYIPQGTPTTYEVKVDEKESLRTYGMIPVRTDSEGKPIIGWETVSLEDAQGNPRTGWDYESDLIFEYVLSPSFGQDEQDLKIVDFFLRVWILAERINYLIVENNQDIGLDDAISFLFQDGKVARNSRGNFVRFEENVSFPSPDTYKLVSLTKEIGGALDEIVLEVKANKQIDNVSPLPNLWLDKDTSKSVSDLYYAVKQRLIITNGQDTIERVYLDGEPKLTTDNYYLNGEYIITNTQIYKTFFDHIYEFINGSSGAIDRVYDTSFRPTNNGDSNGGQTVSGLMWHLRPLLVETRLAGSATVIKSIWEYAFVNTDNTNNTGKMEFTEYKDSSKINHYINYADTQNDGKFSTGEFYEDNNGDGVYTAGTDNILDKVQLGFSGTKDTAYSYQSTGDSTLFYDINENGLNDDGNSTSVDITASNLPTSAALSWASSNRYAYLKEERFLIKDDLVFRVDAFSDVNPTDRSQVSNLFEKFDMERVFTSSKFGGRSIDTFITPRRYLDADLIELKIEASESIDQR